MSERHNYFYDPVVDADMLDIQVIRKQAEAKGEPAVIHFHKHLVACEDKDHEYFNIPTDQPGLAQEVKRVHDH